MTRLSELAEFFGEVGGASSDEAKCHWLFFAIVGDAFEIITIFGDHESSL